MAEHNDLGKLGEALAKSFLKKKGFEVLHENWRFEHYEVDLIAKSEKFLIFIEVKTRNTMAFGSPESFVSRKQQLHLAESVEAYLYKYPNIKMDIRYDVISVIVNGNVHEITHFEDAFWPDNLSTFSID